MTASPGSRLCAKPPKAREQVSAAKGMGAGARHGLRGIRGILMADFERDAEQLQSADFSDVEQFYLVVYWSRYGGTCLMRPSPTRRRQMKWSC